MYGIYYFIEIHYCQALYSFNISLCMAIYEMKKCQISALLCWNLAFKPGEDAYKEKRKYQPRLLDSAYIIYFPCARFKTTAFRRSALA
jgi:hypothetical protein